MAYKVFIHSSSKDIDIVQDLAHRLEGAGIEKRGWTDTFAGIRRYLSSR